MDKLKSSIVGKNLNTLTNEEREEKILYYRDLFRLTFRVFDEDAIDDIEEVDDVLDSLSSCDESDVVYFQDKFTALGALDVFYTLCLEYYEEQLAVVRKNGLKLLEPQSDEEVKPAKKKYLSKQLKMKNERIQSNLEAQHEYQVQIDLVKNKMKELGMIDNVKDGI